MREAVSGLGRIALWDYFKDSTLLGSLSNDNWDGNENSKKQ